MLLVVVSCALIASLAAPSEGGAYCEIASLEGLFRRIERQVHNVEKAADFGCKACHEPCDKPCINSIVNEDLVADVAHLKQSLQDIAKTAIPCEGSRNVFIGNCQDETIYRLNVKEVSHFPTRTIQTITAADDVFDFVIDATSGPVTINFFIASPFQVFTRDLTGGAPTLVADDTDLPTPNFAVNSIAYFADNDELLVPVIFTDGTQNRISAITRTGRNVRTVAEFDGSAIRRVTVADGVVYAIIDDEIVTVDATTTDGTLSTLFTHAYTIEAFDVTPMGTLLFIDEYGDLFSVDLDTIEITQIFETTITTDASDLRFNKCDGLVYIAYESSDQVELLEPNGILVKTLTLPFGPLSCPNIDLLPKIDE